MPTARKRAASKRAHPVQDVSNLGEEPTMTTDTTTVPNDPATMDWDALLSSADLVPAEEMPSPRASTDATVSRLAEPVKQSRESGKAVRVTLAGKAVITFSQVWRKACHDQGYGSKVAYRDAKTGEQLKFAAGVVPPLRQEIIVYCLATEKHTRTRRTKEQIAAEKAAKEAGTSETQTSDEPVPY